MDLLTTFHTADGTHVEIHRTYVKITLPDGRVVHATPQHNEMQALTARHMGYGEDVDAMTRDHDPLHVLLCDWVGVPSFSLAAAAGDPVDGETAGLEEDAVMALQRWMRHIGVSVPSLARRAGRRRRFKG